MARGHSKRSNGDIAIPGAQRSAHHWVFRADHEAPAAARTAVNSILPRRRVDDLLLLVSELVTNSVRHAGMGADDTIEVVVEISGAVVKVEVTDRGPGFTGQAGRPSLDDPSGWGLHLVELLSDAWGVELGPPTVTWFEIELQPR